MNRCTCGYYEDGSGRQIMCAEHMKESLNPAIPLLKLQQDARENKILEIAEDARYNYALGKKDTGDKLTELLRVLKGDESYQMGFNTGRSEMREEIKEWAIENSSGDEWGADNRHLFLNELLTLLDEAGKEELTKTV